MPLFCDSPLSLFILHLQSPSSSLPSQGCSQSFPILWRCLVLLLIFLLPESPQKICLIFFLLLLSFCFFSVASISFLSPSGDLISRMCVMFHTTHAFTGRGVAGEDKATKGHTLKHSHTYAVLVSPPPQLLSHIWWHFVCCVSWKQGQRQKIVSSAAKVFAVIPFI